MPYESYYNTMPYEIKPIYNSEILWLHYPGFKLKILTLTWYFFQRFQLNPTDYSYFKKEKSNKVMTKFTKENTNHIADFDLHG